MRGLVAAIAVVIVVGVVVVFARSEPPASVSPSDPGTGKAPVVVKGGSASDAVLMPVKVVLECETPTTIESKNPKDGTEVLHINEISDGVKVRYLEVDNGFIDRCALGKDKEIAGKLPGRCSYEFEVPRKDTYYIYLRAKWRDNCGNSAWVGIDEDKWYNLEDEEGQIGEKNYKWAWHPLWVQGAPKGFELTPGKHTLWFNVREDGPKLDQWLVSTEAQKPVGANPVKK